MNIKSDEIKISKTYKDLEEYSKKRTVEFSEMLANFIKVTDYYGDLICRVTLVLGKIPPRDKHDSMIRDLMADVFDFLYEVRPIIIKGKFGVAFPLGRRAYESLSLMVASCLDKKLAERWIAGNEIGNAEIRNILDENQMGESKGDTKELYKFFSQATHPNRGLVPERFLGAGNKFVLGAIGSPDLIMTVDFCHRILELWFWFVAFITYINKENIVAYDKEIFDCYFIVANEAKGVAEWLIDNFNRLLEEYQTEIKGKKNEQSKT